VLEGLRVAAATGSSGAAAFLRQPVSSATSRPTIAGSTFADVADGARLPRVVVRADHSSDGGAVLGTLTCSAQSRA